MKKFMLLFAFVSVFAFSNLLFAQPLLHEDFNFSGFLYGNGWGIHSSLINPIQTTTGLTYAGYIGSGVGNAAALMNTGQDVNRTFATQSGNGTSVFVSFLVNVNDAAATKNGDYILNIGSHNSDTTFTNFCGRFLARIVAGNVNFGVENLSSTPTYGATNFAKNTTYLAVIKYTINTAGADSAKLWIFTSGVPSTEALAGEPEGFIYTELGKDTINAVALRQGSSSNCVTSIVDGIHISNNWDVTVPVELTSFSAAAVNNSVRLSWSTATETNNQGFVVEKSANKANWSKIAFVAGSGNSSKPLNYSYLDNSSLNGKNYYRLKQLDNSGSFEYSKVIEVNVNSPKEYKLFANYPNPFNPSTKIAFSLAESQVVKLRVFNMLGQEVKILLNSKMDAGRHEITFNAGSLTSGVYIYKLEAGNFVQTKTMMLVK